MSETNIVQAVRLAASKLGTVLFRNNRGKLQDKNGRWVDFGIGGDGGSDLIGWTPLIITPDMIGKRIAVFTAYEIKTEQGMKPSGKKAKEHFQDQVDFIESVKKAGGIAAMITSESQLK